MSEHYENYWYELWDGEKVIGYYLTPDRAQGIALHIPQKTTRDIVVPLVRRTVKSTFSDSLSRLVLDVSGLTKKQIKILKTYSA